MRQLSAPSSYTHRSNTVFEHVIVRVPGQTARQPDVVEMPGKAFDLGVSWISEILLTVSKVPTVTRLFS